MACTYDYTTGKITLDFHLVKWDEICDLKGIKGKVGQYGCQYCPFNGGFISDTSDPIDWQTFTKCKHKDAKDSNGSLSVKWKLYDDFEREALAHYYD